MGVAWRCALGCLTIGALAFVAPSTLAADRIAERPSEQKAAAQIDAAFQQSAKACLPARVDDQTFLRRVSLDLTGRTPSSDEIRRFVEDISAGKREAR